MTVESATTIDQLDPTLPAGTNSLAEGQGHLRLLKATLKATFPAVVGATTITTAILNTLKSAFSGAGSLDLQPPAAAAAQTPQGAQVYLRKGATGNDVLVGTYNGQAQLLVVTPPEAPATIPTYAGAIVSNTGTMDLVGPQADVLVNGFSLTARTVPSGMIAMWYGAVSNIPAGWALCNGQNLTPDLRNRFVMGAGLDFAPGQAGGATIALGVPTSTVGAHYHTGTVSAEGAHYHSASADLQGYHAHTGTTIPASLGISQLPPHSHNLEVQAGPGPGAGIVYALNVSTGVGLQTDSVGNGDPHAHGIYPDGSHTHNLSVSTVGDHIHSIAADGSHSHTVNVPTLPPYMCLCFIMKL